jgi:hypothetical protein
MSAKETGHAQLQARKSIRKTGLVKPEEIVITRHYQEQAYLKLSRQSQTEVAE